MRTVKSTALLTAAVLLMITGSLFGQGAVKIGMNYPKTGPYAVMGLDQLRAAQMAAEEINGAGGIMGRRIELVYRDSKSNADVTRENVASLIDVDGASMVFGGSSSGVALAAADVCNARQVPFFATLAYATGITGSGGYRTTFRECYDSWMAARAIGDYLTTHYPGKRYFYITADYNWGWSTEAAVRTSTNTEDKSKHIGLLVPSPGAQESDFKRALSFAQMIKPDVVVLVLFGSDMVDCIRIATTMGIKKDVQLVVPNLTLGMAEGAGPKVMEGVIGAVPWTWQVPVKYSYSRGQEFVDKYSQKYDRYPSTSGASAYTIVYEYKSAVERAGSFRTDAVVKALENHKYTLLKDAQQWRGFDHQSIQTVYLVKCRKEPEVLTDKYRLDYFEIISSIPGELAAKTYEEWLADRKLAGASSEL